MDHKPSRIVAPVFSIFFYGWLRDPALLEVVLGDVIPPERLLDAKVSGYETRRLADVNYPTLSSSATEMACGLVLTDVTGEEFERIKFFEGPGFRLAPLTTVTDNGAIEAMYFQVADEARATGTRWDYGCWSAEDHRVLRVATLELMGIYGKVAPKEVDALWPGILRRAHQKTRAAKQTPEQNQVQGGLRQSLTRADLVIEETTRVYTGFIALDIHKLHHRRFDGSWTEQLTRLSVAWGDAVTVLPYDPVRDRVLLIEQFRTGPGARGDASPWCIEVIAGLIEAGESAESTVRREVVEEAGVAVGRLRNIGSYYPSPGTCCEQVTGFIGEANLDGEGGRFGLASEGEDIRSIIVDFDAALAAADAGEVNAGPAVISLLWLTRHRERLRADWDADTGPA